MILKFTLQHAVCAKKIIASFLLIFFMTSFATHAQQCDGSLIVEKNRNFKSAFQQGALFTLVLTNTSSSKNTYIIGIDDLATSCANKNKKTSAPNVVLTKTFLDAQHKDGSNYSVSLAPGASYKFRMNITAPIGTPYNTWGCIQVNAITNTCDSKSMRTVLSVFVPDPSKD